MHRIEHWRSVEIIPRLSRAKRFGQRMQGEYSTPMPTRISHPIPYIKTVQETYRRLLIIADSR